MTEKEFDANMHDIMQRMKSRREMLNMSYQTLSEKVGISKSTLQRYETGYIKNMPVDKLGDIAKALNVSPAYLMGWEDLPVTEHNDFRLSNIEKEIITEYRKADAITQAMVLRALSIDEPATPKAKKGLLA